MKARKIKACKTRKTIKRLYLKVFSITIKLSWVNCYNKNKKIKNSVIYNLISLGWFYIIKKI